MRNTTNRPSADQSLGKTRVLRSGGLNSRFSELEPLADFCTRPVGAFLPARREKISRLLSGDQRGYSNRWGSKVSRDDPPLAVSISQISLEPIS
jgi:hypothetical protein